MIYVTGDTHGNQVLWDIGITSFLKKGDIIIVTGDFGIGFFNGKYWAEEMFFDYLAEQEYTTLFCDGNHENFDKLKAYDISEWNGGKVHRIRDNVIHLMRGEIYEIEDRSIFVMGGGYSNDKEYRIPEKNWWPDEMPGEEEYQNARDNLGRKGYRVDYIFTHTAPSETIEYMLHMNRGIKEPGKEERPLEVFLDWVETMTYYNKWYFGHFHMDAELWKNQYAVYDCIRNIHTGELIKMR